MLCDNCGEKEATFFYTETDKQGNEKKYNLCAKCAEIKGASKKLTPSIAAQLLAGLLEISTQEEGKGLVCSVCKLTYNEFRRNGRLGCAHCYTAFEENLESLLRKIHGTTKHSGKRPGIRDEKRTDLNERILGLKYRLEEAIKKEEYELAAQLRDKIKELEKELSNR